VALGQRATVVDRSARSSRGATTSGCVQVRALAVVEDRERPVEAVAGEALLEAERAVGAAELQCGAWRDVAGMTMRSSMARDDAMALRAVRMSDAEKREGGGQPAISSDASLFVRSDSAVTFTVTSQLPSTDSRA
jgi:hypothetical protein